MTTFILQPWHLLLLCLAGWMNRQQQDVINHLLLENQIVKEKLGKKRILLNDDQRRRVAVSGKVLDRKLLEQVATLFTPDTILRWHRKRVAPKFDYSHKRKSVGRPRVVKAIVIWSCVSLARIPPGDTIGSLALWPTWATHFQIKRWATFSKTTGSNRPTDASGKPPGAHSSMPIGMFGEKSLRRPVNSYLDHYHRERNHQGLDNQIIDPSEEVGATAGEIECHERLGGILKYYHRVLVQRFLCTKGNSSSLAF